MACNGIIMYVEILYVSQQNIKERSAELRMLQITNQHQIWMSVTIVAVFIVYYAIFLNWKQLRTKQIQRKYLHNHNSPKILECQMDFSK